MQKETIKIQRETNFELLRLVAMYLIVLGHCILHGMRNITSQVIPDLGFRTSSVVDMFNFGTSQFLAYSTTVGVNLFVLITGYFITRPMTFHKVIYKSLKLWMLMVLYSVIILLFNCLYSFDNFTLKNIITAITPIYHNNYWFMTQYLALFLLSPYIIKLLDNLGKREFHILICLLFIFNFQQESIGYGHLFSFGRLFFFIFLFILGNYIHRFNPLAKYQHYGIAFFCLSCLTMAILSIAMQIARLGTSGHEFLYIKSLANYSFTIFNAVALFLWFKTIHVDRQRINYFILACSSHVLSVYLIHDNSVIRKLLWNNIKDYVHEEWFIPYLLFYVLLVFASCIIIDKIRSFCIIAPKLK